MPASGSDSEDSADERQDGPSNEGGWIEAIGSVVGIAAEYAADFFVSGPSSSEAASNSFGGDVGSSSSASSAGGVGTSALGAGVSTKKRTRCDRDKGEMLRLPICSSNKLGGGSDVCMKPCVVGRSYEGSPLFLMMTILTIHFKTVAAELFSELFTLQGSDAMTSAEYDDYNDGDGSDDGQLDGESPASRIRVSNPQQRTGRITFDVSTLQLPLVLPQQHSDSVSFFFCVCAVRHSECCLRRDSLDI
jgi:hypothetical protein